MGFTGGILLDDLQMGFTGGIPFAEACATETLGAYCSPDFWHGGDWGDTNPDGAGWALTLFLVLSDEVLSLTVSGFNSLSQEKVSSPQISFTIYTFT